MAENTYLNKGGVQVSNTRTIMAGKTYSMANITSVSMGEQRGNGTGAIGLGVVVGAFALFVLPSDMRGLALLIALIFIGLGVWVITQVTYSVKIGSTSGETQGMTSKKRGEIEEIVEAINRAIIERG